MGAVMEILLAKTGKRKTIYNDEMIITTEMIEKWKTEITAKGQVVNKDSKGNYTAKVLECYIKGDELWVKVEKRP